MFTSEMKLRSKRQFCTRLQKAMSLASAPTNVRAQQSVFLLLSTSCINLHPLQSLIFQEMFGCLLMAHFCSYPGLI